MAKVSWKDPLVIRKKKFANADEVAAHFGLTRHAVMSARLRGRLDYIGLHPSQTRVRSGAAPTPVTIRGKTYPSAKVAASRLNVSQPTIVKALTKGTQDAVGLKKRGKYKYPKGKALGDHHMAKEVVLGSYRWSTIKQACADLGLSYKVFSRMRQQNDPELLGLAMAFSARRDRELRGETR